MALVRSRSLGGLMARPLVAASLLGPPLLGLLVLSGERAGLYDSGVSFTLLVTSFGAAGFLLVSVIAQVVNRADLTLRALHIRDAQIDAFFDASPVGMALLDRDLRYIKVNQALASINGASAASHIGRTIAEVLPTLADQIVPMYERIRSTGEPFFDRELTGVTPTDPGTQRSWIVSYFPIHDHRPGEVALFGGVVVEITELKRLQEDLRGALRSRDEFLSIASHDLKTPLTSLGLQLERLLQLVEHALPSDGGRVTPPLAEGAVRLARRQADRMRGLIDDLLDLTRIRAGRLTLCRAELDLAQAARDAVAALSPELERLGIAVSLHAGGPVRGCWDPRRIDQVLTNLLSNAIKYGRKQPVDVWIDVDRGRGQARVRVVDRGIGISPAQQALIFERFERAVEGRAIKGLGLGLYITRQIVEAHGGAIRVESAPDEGSTFEVTLPLAEPG